MKVKDISSFLENIAPLAHQEDYDNAGLIVGDPEMDIKKGLVCLDCTEDIVGEAIDNNCDLIVSHHPILFGGLKKINVTTYVERVITTAIKNDIAIYAMHTNLDNDRYGVNSKLCDKLGLKDCEILVPKSGTFKKLYTFCPSDQSEKVRKALFEAGAGHIGNYSECSFNTEGHGTFKGKEGTDPYVGKPGELHQENETKIETIFPARLQQKIVDVLCTAHPYEEVAYDIIQLDNTSTMIGAGMIGHLDPPQSESNYLKKVKEILGTNCIRHTKFLDSDVNKVAVCGGSGSFLLNAAIEKGATIFITSDLKYHQFFDAEEKIVIADIGHYESEQHTIELIYDLIKKKFPTFAVLFTKVNTNPVNYL